MKKIIALIAALAMVLSLSACFSTGTTEDASTSDQVENADVSDYDKDFDGLVQYIIDSNSGCEKQELYYDLLGAENGVKLILNKNAYVEIYDFYGEKETSSWVDSDNLPRAIVYGEEENSSSADSSDLSKPQQILNEVRENGKFKPMENGIELTAAITDSGHYVIAWDATRSYDYDKKVATDEVKANW